MKYAYIEATGEVTGLNRQGYGLEATGNCTPQQLVWGMASEKYKVVDGVFTPLTKEESDTLDAEVATSLLIETNRSQAKITREDVINSDIEVFGVVWQVDDKDRTNIKEAIDYSNDNNLPDETTQNWILADNTTRPSTKLDLREVLNKYTERKGQVFYQYIVWCQSDMMSPFEYIESDNVIVQ